MTKKSEKILNELEKRFDTCVFLYRENFKDYGYCYQAIYEEEDNCMQMVSQMFHFHLLSENDFTGLYEKMIVLRDNYTDLLNLLHVEKTGYLR